MALATLHSADEWVSWFGESRKATAVTIGNFDGMHRGHQEIVRRVLQHAVQMDLMASVLTLFPHPSRIVRPAQAPSLLTTLDQRLRAFEASGIDAALVLPFNDQLAKMVPNDFVRMFLAETMRARIVLVGEDFRFGHKQAGDIKMLVELGKQSGFGVESVPAVTEHGVLISSTAIRHAVREGRMEDASRMLGRPFGLEGEISRGTGQGRKLVVPTLNLTTEQETLPKLGVYATSRLYYKGSHIARSPTWGCARRLTVQK